MTTVTSYEHNGVSKHQQLNCLLHGLVKLREEKTINLRGIMGLFRGTYRLPVDSHWNDVASFSRRAHKTFRDPNEFHTKTYEIGPIQWICIQHWGYWWPGWPVIVTMMVADVLAPDRHSVASNHYTDSIVTGVTTQHAQRHGGRHLDNYVWYGIPADTWRTDDVIITPKRRHKVFWRNNGVIIMLYVRWGWTIATPPVSCQVIARCFNSSWLHVGLYVLCQ